MCCEFWSCFASSVRGENQQNNCMVSTRFTTSISASGVERWESKELPMKELLTEGRQWPAPLFSSRDISAGRLWFRGTPVPTTPPAFFIKKNRRLWRQQAKVTDPPLGASPSAGMSACDCSSQVSVTLVALSLQTWKLHWTSNLWQCSNPIYWMDAEVPLLCTTVIICITSTLVAGADLVLASWLKKISQHHMTSEKLYLTWTHG